MLAVTNSLASCVEERTVDQEPRLVDMKGDDASSVDDYDASLDELASAYDPVPLAHELTLFMIPAPEFASISWKNPGALARSTLWNKGWDLARAVGHAGVRLQCASIPGHPGGEFQGSVRELSDTYRSMIFDEKAGLSVLFAGVDGRLETQRELQETINERYASGRITFIRFMITGEVCHALLDYVRAFDAANVADTYGFVRPLYQEGAGCSAFSMAFLQLAGLDTPSFRRAWAFDVRVPLSLMGTPFNPDNRVSALELATSTRGWANEGEPHMRLIGWDPTKMYKSVRAPAREALAQGETYVERRGKAIGVVFNATNYAPRDKLRNRTFWAGPPGAPRHLWSFGDP